MNDLIVSDNMVYQYDKYQFKNFTQMSDEEAQLVLTWRNHPSIRMKMINTDIITINEHLTFISTLKKREDCSYWLAYRDMIPYGTVYFTNINRKENSAELGYLISPEYMDRGGGLTYAVSINQFASYLGLKVLHGTVKQSNFPAMILEEYMGGIKQGETSMSINDETVMFNIYKRDIEAQSIQVDRLKDMRNFLKFYREKLNK